MLVEILTQDACSKPFSIYQLVYTKLQVTCIVHLDT